MKIRPLHDYVLLKRCEAEQKAGSIIIPSSAQSKSDRAEVLAVGPGLFSEATHQRIEPSVKVGDVVLLAQWSGTELDERGERTMMIRESEILGVEERA